MTYTIDNPKLVSDIFSFEGVKNFSGVVKDKNNNIVYYLNGKFHRTDGPAIEWRGSKFWCLNGKRHREDGPAIVHSDGGKDWYLNNKYHGINNDFTNESWIRFVRLQLLK
jgi:hypothetical protein